MVYFQNLGVPPDNAKAFECFEKAADQDHAWAQYYLGEMYRQGLGVAAPDYAKACEWYEKAAAQGIARARKVLEALTERLKPRLSARRRP